MQKPPSPLAATTISSSGLTISAPTALCPRIRPETMPSALPIAPGARRPASLTRSNASVISSASRKIGAGTRELVS